MRSGSDGGWLGRSLAWLSALAVQLSAGVIVVTMIVVTGNAVLRYFFKSGSGAVFDIERFAFPFIIFLGLAATNRSDGHARVGLLLGLVGAKGRQLLLRRLVPCLAMIYIAALAVSTGVLTWRYAQGGTTIGGLMPVPLWMMTIVMPVTTLLALAVLALDYRRFWNQPAAIPSHGHAPEPHAADHDRRGGA